MSSTRVDSADPLLKGATAAERPIPEENRARTAWRTLRACSSESIGVTVQSEFLVCAGGSCIPTDGPLRLERHLGVDYIIGRSTWERCESAGHAEQRLAGRMDELDPHELASEAVALADPGFD